MEIRLEGNSEEIGEVMSYVLKNLNLISVLKPYEENEAKWKDTDIIDDRLIVVYLEVGLDKENKKTGD